jgi:uncharacterized protein (DUF2267 family)
MAATGWRPWEIDDMTLLDVSDLLKHWELNPPAHVVLSRLLAVVAAAAGIDTSSSPPPAAKDVLGAASTAQQQGSIDELLSMFPGGVIKG